MFGRLQRPYVTFHTWDRADRNQYRPGWIDGFSVSQTSNRGHFNRLRLRNQRIYLDPSRLDNERGQVVNAALAVSVFAVAWLNVCALADLRTRCVPNWLTLPAILLALGYRLFSSGGVEGTTILQLLAILLPLLVAWRHHLVGGADVKILLVLALLDPYLVLAALLGVIVYLSAYLIFRRTRPARFAGVPGFAVGVLFLTIFQFVSNSIIRNGIS